MRKDSATNNPYAVDRLVVNRVVRACVLGLGLVDRRRQDVEDARGDASYEMTQELWIASPDARRAMCISFLLVLGVGAVVLCGTSSPDRWSTAQDFVDDSTSLNASHYLVRRIEVEGGSLSPPFAPDATEYAVQLPDREYDDVETLRIQVWDPRTLVYVHGRVHGPCREADEVFYVNASVVGHEYGGEMVKSVPLQANVTQAVDGKTGSNIAEVRLTPLDFGVNVLTVVVVLPGRDALEAEQRLAYTVTVTRVATTRHSKLSGIRFTDVHPDDACLQYDTTGEGHTGSGRSMFLLTHCHQVTTARVSRGGGPEVHREKRREFTDELPSENLWVMYVKYHYRQIRLIPVALASCARITIAGVDVPRGEASPAIVLDAQDAGAETKLKIVVTAEDGLGQTVYRLHIMRLVPMPPPPWAPPLRPPPRYDIPMTLAEFQRREGKRQRKAGSPATVTIEAAFRPGDYEQRIIASAGTPYGGRILGFDGNPDTPL